MTPETEVNPAPLASRWSELSWQSVGMGLLVAVVGFTSSFAIVLQGFRAAGATDAQAASGLMALSIGMGLSGLWLSLTRRLPISVAWSTPGAALLIASGDSLPDFSTAVGVFIACAMLLIIAGHFKPLARLIDTIPASLANAMLAGILLVLCLAPVKAIAFEPAIALPVIGVWWLTGLFNRLFAVPAALCMLLALVFLNAGLPAGAGGELVASLRPQPVLTLPSFDLASLTGVALPLFVVTMASQNVPGVAVLRANGYAVPAGPLIGNTGMFSLLAAPFGSHAINLAALTAAMCAGSDAHAEPGRRYWAAAVAGLFYVVFGLFAGSIVLLATLIPAILIEAVAGLALIGAFSGALVAAFQQKQEREAAAVTFLFSASGLALAGIGGAFWGLLAGVLMLKVQQWKQSRA